MTKLLLSLPKILMNFSMMFGGKMVKSLNHHCFLDDELVVLVLVLVLLGAEDNDSGENLILNPESVSGEDEDEDEEEDNELGNKEEGKIKPESEFRAIFPNIVEMSFSTKPVESAKVKNDSQDPRHSRTSLHVQ